MNGHSVRKVVDSGQTVTVMCECLRAFVGLTFEEAVEAYGDHRAAIADCGQCPYWRPE